MIFAAARRAAIDFKELYHYRELLFFLTSRDVEGGADKQTVLGFAWAIIQPVMNVIIQAVSLERSRVLTPKSRWNCSSPHSLHAVHLRRDFAVDAFRRRRRFRGKLAGQSAESPDKSLLPPAFRSGLGDWRRSVDTLISLGVFLILMACFRVAPVWQIIFVPFLLLLTSLAATAMAFTLSSLTVTYRDFRFLIPFMVSTWQLVSPVGYPLDPHRQWIRWILRCNPMYGIINAFRSSLLGQHWDIPGLVVSIIEVAGLLVFGLYYFKKTERRFADIA